MEWETCQKMSGIYYIPDYKKGVLRLTWDNCLKKPEYTLRKSNEYKDFCEKYNLEEVCTSHTDFRQEGNEIVAYPKPQKYGDYTFIRVSVTDKTLQEVTCISGSREEGYIVLHKGKRLTINKDGVPYYYSHNTLYVDMFVGLWEENLVYVAGDGIYMIMPSGEISFVGPYPDMSESGKVSISLTGDSVTVSEYVYYDCGHKHGGYEKEIYKLEKKEER